MESIQHVQEQIWNVNNRVQFKKITDNKSYNAHEIVEDIVDCIKKGDIEFLMIILESDVENEILKYEKDVFDSYMKYKLITLEEELLKLYKITFSTYLNRTQKGENIADLSEELFEKLKYILCSTMNDALELEQNSNKAFNFLMFKVNVDEFLIQVAKCSKYFNKYVQYAPFDDIVKRLDKINQNLIEVKKLKEHWEIKHFEAINLMNSSHFRLQSYNQGLKLKFIDLLSDSPHKIPISYQFDPLNKTAIYKMLNNKISPLILIDDNDNTLLHIAIECGRLEIFNLLLNRGAQPFFKNKLGLSAMQMAASHDDSRYLAAINATIQSSEISDMQLKNIEDSNIRDMLKPLREAENILNEYGVLLTQRKNLIYFFRSLFQYECRLVQRSNEIGEYYQRLTVVFNELDPHIFLNEIDRKYRSASRGLLGRSALHDNLKHFKDRFLEIFDEYGFNELKKHYRKNSSTQNSDHENQVNNTLKHQAELIDKLKIELEELKLQFKNDNNLPKRPQQKTPKLTLF